MKTLQIAAIGVLAVGVFAWLYQQGKQGANTLPATQYGSTWDNRPTVINGRSTVWV